MPQKQPPEMTAVSRPFDEATRLSTAGLGNVIDAGVGDGGWASAPHEAAKAAMATTKAARNAFCDPRIKKTPSTVPYADSQHIGCRRHPISFERPAWAACRGVLPPMRAKDGPEGYRWAWLTRPSKPRNLAAAPRILLAEQNLASGDRLMNLSKFVLPLAATVLFFPHTA